MKRIKFKGQSSESRWLSKEVVWVPNAQWQQLVDASHATGMPPDELGRWCLDAFLADRRRGLNRDGLAAKLDFGHFQAT
jgi:hypothetical protein